MRKHMITLLAATALSGCTQAQLDKLETVGQMPPLEEIKNPIEEKTYAPVSWPSPPPPERTHIRTANSLWEPGARTFFRDMRARDVGDILRVRVRIDDRAELENTTERKRSATETLPIPNAFGLQKRIRGILPAETEADNLLGIDSQTDTSGEGTIDREEKIEAEIAAMITQVLPNGNLVIYGSQEVRVNFEVRQLAIHGVVRPGDISPENEVQLNQIAEARVSYGGRGTITDVQEPRIGQQIVDILSPF